MDHERTPDPQLEDMIPEDRKSKQSVCLADYGELCVCFSQSESGKYFE